MKFHDLKPFLFGIGALRKVAHLKAGIGKTLGAFLDRVPGYYLGKFFSLVPEKSKREVFQPRCDRAGRPRRAARG